MRLTALLVIQIVAWVKGYGLEERPCCDTSPFLTKPDTNSKFDWQGLVKDATFKSLQKYITFTQSPENRAHQEKLLWEKLHSANFFASNSREPDGIRKGVLMESPENGAYEFREGDKITANCPGAQCPLNNKKILMTWNIHNDAPNGVWIAMKMQDNPTIEDYYEYTPRYGLKQINLKFLLARLELKKEENDEEEEEREILEELTPIDRQDRNIFEAPHYESLIRLKPPYPTYNHKKSIQQRPGPLQAQYRRGLPNKKNYDSQTQQTVWINEFLPNTNHYDGFLPSIGPLEPPSPYQALPINYFPHREQSYKVKFPQEFRPPQKFLKPPTPQHHFNPSFEYVRYSEEDSFLHSQQPPLEPQENSKENLDYHYVIIPNNVKNENIPKLAQVSQLPTVNTPHKIRAQQPTVENRTPSRNKVPRPTLKSKLKTEVTDNIRKEPLLKLQKDFRQAVLPTANTPSSTTSENTSTFNYTIEDTNATTGDTDVTTLRPEWGMRIKSRRKPTTQRKDSLRRNAPKDNNNSQRVRGRYTTERGIRTTISPVFPTFTVEEQEAEGSTYTTSNYDYIDTTFPTLPETDSNIEVSGTTPEEIVTTLTTMGVQNRTQQIGGYDQEVQSSNRVSDKYAKVLHLDSAEIPTSLIVNRISKSVSYKTSGGQTGNIKNRSK